MADLLADALDVAVPMALDTLAAMSEAGRADAITRWAVEAVDVLASGGDQMLFPTKPSRATKRHVAEPGTRGVFAATARGIAAAAYAPGGITTLGRHWCVDHAVCQAARAKADERARQATP